MPKLRLEIGTREILMKDIINVTIDGVEYRKSMYMDENDTRIIQGFYHFVKKFKEKITSICYSHFGSKDYICFIYFEDGKDEYISVPWGEEQYTNTQQKHNEHKCGLDIIISNMEPSGPLDRNQPGEADNSKATL